MLLFYETDYSEMEAALCWGGETKCNFIFCGKSRRLYPTHVLSNAMLEDVLMQLHGFTCNFCYHQSK
jgi:hypothetical protein